MALYRVRCAWCLIGALGGLVAADIVTAASTIVDVGGFEGFNLTALAGQQGWNVSGPGGGVATVQSDVVRSGSKALRVDRAPGADHRWSVPLGGSHPTVRFILVEWDMRVTQTAAPLGAVGPFLGVEAYDDQGFFGLLGAYGIDVSTGKVLYQRQDDGAFIDSGATAVFNAWNNFRAVFDFSLHRYSAYFNGQNLANTGFVDRGASGTNLDQFTDANISAIGAAGDGVSQNLVGTAYFDNFRVVDGIPGDFDGDGDVDSADLAAWKPAFGVTGAADADGDADADGADFLAWQRYLGSDFTPATANASSAPEPAAPILALLLAAPCARRRSLRTSLSA